MYQKVIISKLVPWLPSFHQNHPTGPASPYLFFLFYVFDSFYVKVYLFLSEVYRCQTYKNDVKALQNFIYHDALLSNTKHNSDLLYCFDLYTQRVLYTILQPKIIWNFFFEKNYIWPQRVRLFFGLFFADLGYDKVLVQPESNLVQFLWTNNSVC